MLRLPVTAQRPYQRGDVGWRYFPQRRRWLRAELLRVAFAGVYALGSSGNREARTIVDALEVGLARWKPSGLVIDLTEMSYGWGDDMALIIEFSRSHEKASKDLDVAILTSPLNESALHSLALALGTETGKLFFRRLEDVTFWDAA